MITAIDTNVLLDILVPNEAFYEASANALQDAAGEGSLAVSNIREHQPSPKCGKKR